MLMLEAGKGRGEMETRGEFPVSLWEERSAAVSR